MKLIITAKNAKASHILEDEYVDIKNLNWLEKKQFNLMFEVVQHRGADGSGRLESIELVAKNRIPAMVAPGLMMDEVAKSLKRQGLSQKDFSVEEDRS